MFKNIIVATDFGEIAEHAVDRAVHLAKEVGAKVTLLHVAQMPPYYYGAYAEGLSWPTDELEGAARRALDKALARAKETYPLTEALLVVGVPQRRIVDTAVEREADLLVIGTHGRRGLARALLGSVAERVVRTAPMPVLTIST